MGQDQQTPAPDPTLAAQTAQAQQVEGQQVQNAVGADTQNMWNLFGNGTQLSYVQVPQAAPSAAPAPAAAPTGPVSVNPATGVGHGGPGGSANG